MPPSRSCMRVGRRRMSLWLHMRRMPGRRRNPRMSPSYWVGPAMRWSWDDQSEALLMDASCVAREGCTIGRSIKVEFFAPTSNHPAMRSFWFCRSWKTFKINLMLFLLGGTKREWVLSEAVFHLIIWSIHTRMLTGFLGVYSAVEYHQVGECGDDCPDQSRLAHYLRPASMGNQAKQDDQRQGSMGSDVFSPDPR